MTRRNAHPPFVLLHGGRHGGWCWARVAPLLREAGHGVYTPTLTGLGERAHLLRRDIGIETHIQDLVAVFDFEDITDAVLVAHSYGGCVVAGAMEQIADRVQSLMLIEALVPRSGESMFDIVDPEISRASTAPTTSCSLNPNVSPIFCSRKCAPARDSHCTREDAASGRAQPKLMITAPRC